MTITIPPHDRHGLRVFAAKLTPDDLKRDRASLAIALLGDPDLDPAHVEIFDSADLADLGLSGYLAEGFDVADPLIARDRGQLDGVTGPVLILRSRAFHGRGVTLSPDPRLTLIGTYAETSPAVHFEPLPTASAHGSLHAALPSPLPPRLPRAFLIFGAALMITALAALYLALG